MSNHQNPLKSILILMLAIFLFVPFACEQTIDPLQDEELIKISQEEYARPTKNSRLNGNVYEKFTPKWEESEVIDLKNGGKIVMAPLKSSLNVTYSNELGFSRKLVVEFDKRMSIKSTEILEIVGTPDFVKNNKKLIIENRNENEIKDFEGGVVISDVNYTTHDGKAFNRGKKNGIAKIANKEKGARKMFYCVDWYWVSNGNWTYLYTTCEAGSEGGGGGGEEENGDENLKCKPCTPVPAGGTAYEYHSEAAGNDPHYGMPNHTHHFRMNQSPTNKGCKCGWTRDYIHPTEGFSPLPGEIPVSQSGGGGVY